MIFVGLRLDWIVRSQLYVKEYEMSSFEKILEIRLFVF